MQCRHFWTYFFCATGIFNVNPCGILPCIAMEHSHICSSADGYLAYFPVLNMVNDADISNFKQVLERVHFLLSWIFSVVTFLGHR